MDFLELLKTLNEFARVNTIPPGTPIWFQLVEDDEDPELTLGHACEGLAITMDLQKGIITD